MSCDCLSFCPTCGRDLKASGVIERDGFRIEPTGVVYFNGDRLKLAPQPAMMLYSLAKAEGRTMGYDALLRRISVNANDINLPTVVASILRVKLKKMRIPIPFETDWGHGFRWASSKKIEELKREYE